MSALAVNGETLRLMAVHAHPDDETSKGAATMAKYADEGADVLVVTCTGGERGDILNPQFHLPEGRTMREERREEMAHAAQALHVRQTWLGYVDSGLPEGDPLPPLPEGCFGLVDPHAAALPLAKIIREFRPHVITTYDEGGGYPHPDHVMTHKVSVEGIAEAGDPGFHPELGQPWQVPKLYYNSFFSAEHFERVHTAMAARGLEDPWQAFYDSRSQWGVRKERVTTFVECADYFAARDAALHAHASQIDPDGIFFAIPRDIERDVWPTEEYELVHSTVGVRFPEHDLFAGLRAEN